MKIDILGSCVTRDAFEFNKKDYEILSYFARTSIISLYSNRLNMNQEDIKLSSSFQKKMVYFDLTKKFTNYINNTKSDFLIIDLIDERFRKANVLDSIITYSNEFKNSKLNYKFSFISQNNIKKLWFEKAQDFIIDLRKYNPSKIVLHKAYWKESYLDENNNIISFDNQGQIKENNALLYSFYSYIENLLDDEGINVIEIAGYHADSKHKWGISPFHYEDAYYNEFMKKLSDITNSVG